MNKVFLTIFFLCTTNVFSYAQNYNKYIQQGKNFFNKGEYLTALERFDLAFEFAKTSKEKNEAKSWKNKSRVKIRERLKTADKDRQQLEKQETKENQRKKLIERANKCYKIKDFGCAAQNFAKALELDDRNVDIMTKLTKCYSKLKNYKKAFGVTQKLVKLDSLNYLHHYNFCYYALFNKDYKGAVKAGKKSLLLDEKQNWVFSYIAIAYILDNQYNRAEQIYNKYRNSRLGGYMNMARDGFYNDILKIEKAGIKHPDFEKAKDLLNPHREK